MRQEPERTERTSRSLSSIAEIAGSYSVTTKTIRRWIASGLITGYRVGPRLIRIDPAEVEQMLRKIPTTGGAA